MVKSECYVHSHIFGLKIESKLERKFFDTNYLYPFRKRQRFFYKTERVIYF